jgi:hypothetical protein
MTSAARLALCLCLGMTAGNAASVASPDVQDKKESSSKTSKPRVFTNADLEKYSKAGKTGKASKTVQTTPAAVFPPQEEVAAVPPRTSLPVDDLFEATLPELEERQRELQELVVYLRAKEAWLKNPFLRRPTPPAGEMLLDPSMGGAQELRVTQSRIFAVDTRMGRIRALLQAGGGTTPALQP